MGTAWKAFELRVAKAWGGTRSGPTGRMGPDVSGVPLAIQCKRTTRIGIKGSWIVQARADGKKLGVPWVLVVAQHADRAPVAVVDHTWLVRLWRQAHEQGGRDAGPPV
jgi:hypothetical protein